MAEVAHRIAWHPVVIAAAAVTMLWMDAAVSPLAAIRSLAILVAGVIIVQAVLTLVLRNGRRAALVTLFLFVVIVSKLILLAVEGLASRMEAVVAVVWLLLIAAALLLLARIVLRSVRGWTIGGVTYGLNVFAVMLLAVATINFVISGRVSQVIDDLDQGHPHGVSGPPAPAATDPGINEYPDIYVVLLDGYPRADTLQNVFEYDNAAFLGALSDLGFDVASESRSNYLTTEPTLLSMLHRDYLERIEAVQVLIRGDAPNQPTVRNAINDNPSFDDLRAAGYEIVATPMPFEGSALRRSDVLIDYGHLNEFEVKLLSSTFAGDIVNLAMPAFGADQHRSHVTDSLEALPLLAEEEDARPARLVFAHLITPHSPAVWTSSGEKLNPRLSLSFYGDTPGQQDLSREEFVERHRGQLDHANRLLLETLSAIVREDADAVMVVMSDHGSGIGFESTDPEAWDLRERTGILFAARTPGHPGLFPDSITPVDVFRYLLDAYVDADLGPVEPLPGGRHIEPDELSPP